MFRSQIEMLQHECESELEKAQAYEARILEEAEEVQKQSLGNADRDTVEKKAGHVEFLTQALEANENFVNARFAEIGACLGRIEDARNEERAGEAEARGLAQSYSQMLEQEKKLSQEAKGAYVEEAQRVEMAEAEMDALRRRNGELEDMVKKLELEL